MHSRRGKRQARFPRVRFPNGFGAVVDGRDAARHAAPQRHQPWHRLLEPSDYMTLGDKLIFRANDGEHGYELWVTDGTAEGTQLLKDINVGPGSFIGGWNNQFVLGDRIIFDANDTTHGVELWVTDGTTEGTMLLSDVSPGRTQPMSRTLPRQGACCISRHTTTNGAVIILGDGWHDRWNQISKRFRERQDLRCCRRQTHLQRLHRWAARFFTTDGTPEGTVPIELGGPYPYVIATLGDQLIHAMATSCGRRTERPKGPRSSRILFPRRGAAA